MTGQIAHQGDKAPIQASQRWHVEHTHAWDTRVSIGSNAVPNAVST